jgi:hypothetical protein
MSFHAVPRRDGASMAHETRLSVRQAFSELVLSLAPPSTPRAPMGSGKADCQMRTLTSYGIAVIVVLAVLNGIAWRVGAPRLHGLNVFSAGFVLGMLGMYIAAHLYGYRRVT